jgi:hypothetical protein
VAEVNLQAVLARRLTVQGNFGCLGLVCGVLPFHNLICFVSLWLLSLQVYMCAFRISKHCVQF